MDSAGSRCSSLCRCRLGACGTGTCDDCAPPQRGIRSSARRAMSRECESCIGWLFFCGCIRADLAVYANTTSGNGALPLAPAWPTPFSAEATRSQQIAEPELLRCASSNLEADASFCRVHAAGLTFGSLCGAGCPLLKGNEDVPRLCLANIASSRGDRSLPDTLQCA